MKKIRLTLEGRHKISAIMGSSTSKSEPQWHEVITELSAGPITFAIVADTLNILQDKGWLNGDGMMGMNAVALMVFFNQNFVSLRNAEIGLYDDYRKRRIIFRHGDHSKNNIRVSGSLVSVIEHNNVRSRINAEGVIEQVLQEGLVGDHLPLGQEVDTNVKEFLRGKEGHLKMILSGTTRDGIRQLTAA